MIIVNFLLFYFSSLVVQELLTIITSIKNHYLFINPFIINQINYHQIIIHLYLHIIILQTIIIIITHYDLNYYIIFDFYEHFLIYYQEN